MICAGIDAGSRTIKIVLMDTDSKDIIAKAVTDQGTEQDRLALQLFQKLLKDNNIHKENVHRIVATGYGRDIVSIADTTITEITCHAVGVSRLVPNAKTVIDIGGQDSKLLRLDGNGKVRDFVMNDRCAAGTGRFLEVVAQHLGIELDSLGEMAAKSRSPATISSMCVVFAETEIIGLLATGKATEDIVAGVQDAIASRIIAMAGRNIDLPIIFTGGVAMVPGMDSALRSALQQDITISPHPQITGALGAAILAAKQLNEIKL
ncbi:MAG: acyl-CoA dehydratase activase [Planctomycetota bacterium]|jgi:predicted CoA-substrate-specific enzyme activase